MERAEPGRCPVCRVRFRSQQVCPRCGADLRILMSLWARSYLLRRIAREALGRGDYQSASKSAALAQSICPTQVGGKLLFLAKHLGCRRGLREDLPEVRL